MNLYDKYNHKDFIPTTLNEIKIRGWESVDIIFITGDSYIDHPAFGISILARIAEDMGFKVAVVPQPNWKDDLRDFKKLGKPNLFFGVSAGAMDSMVNHYTAAKRLRSDDAYTPGNKSGFRPDYACYVYSNILKKIFPDVPIIIGGIEASLRRFVHYDYWSDRLKPPILAECNADLLIYGNAEASFIQLLNELKKNKNLLDILPILKEKNFTSEKLIPAEEFFLDLPNACFRINKSYKEFCHSLIEIPSSEECFKTKEKFAKAFIILEKETNKKFQKPIVQEVNDYLILSNPPNYEAEQAIIDYVYGLPFTRLPHPKYKSKKEIPAYIMIRHSVTSHRGCFGGCSFCSISMHQGKFIISRSEESILDEIRSITKMPDFKGYISDVGGPTANMYKMKGTDQNLCNNCCKPSCIFPDICQNLNYNHEPLLKLYQKAQKIKGIKKIFISSGIRHDLLVCKPKEISEKFYLEEYIKQIVKNHVSGRLKVAPEHSSNNVLKIMRKPSFQYYLTFAEKFKFYANLYNQKLYLIPYLISSHPGCKLSDMIILAKDLIKINYKPEQAQEFTPTPMTLASVMYYTGFNPYNGEKIFVPKSKKEREIQKKFIYWYKKENKYFIEKYLK